MTRFTHYTFVVLFGVALLGLTPNAKAVDGTVLINQSTSVSGLPGCPHSGFPIVICQSGSYRLSGNLTVTSTTADAIDVTADNVTIDLNGFSVVGPVVCNGQPLSCNPSGVGSVGINGDLQHYLSVMNGTVRGFGSGLIADLGTVEKVIAVSNSNIGILLEEAVAIHNVASLNHYGISISFGTATGNMVTSNAFGILARCPSSLADNTLITNSSTGSDNTNITLNGSSCALANNAQQ